MGNVSSVSESEQHSFAPDRLTAWIHDRQDATRDDHTNPSAGLATELYQHCLLATSLRVRVLRQQHDLSKFQVRKLAASLSRLHAWGEDLCEGQLDRCVMRSPSLRSSTFEQLIDLGRALLKGPHDGQVLATIQTDTFDGCALAEGLKNLLDEAQRLITVPEDHTGSDRHSIASSQESHGSTQSSWTEDVCQSIDLLTDTAPLIECILAEEDAHDEIQDSSQRPTILVEPNPAQIYITYIQEKYPKMRLDLATHLGEVNLARFIRLRSGDFAPLTAVDRQQDTKSSRAPTFKDSGLGTSVASTIEVDRQTLYSFQTRQSAIERSGRRAIPEMPGLGQPCPICERPLPSRTLQKHLWRTHVFEDLKPYVCIFLNCESSQQTLGTANEFGAHMLNAHRHVDVWTCKYCTAKLATKVDAYSHYAEVHDLSDSEATACALQSHSYIADIERECEFCDEKTWNTPKQYVDHLQKHLEDIALATVSNCAFDEDEENVDEPRPILTLPNDTEQPAQAGASSRVLMTGQTTSLDLNFLRNNPHFRQLRSLVLQQPNMLEPILRQVGAGNPHLAKLISDNPDEFLALLTEDEVGDAQPGTTSGAPEGDLTADEQEAVDRLTRLGFARETVIQAYLACSKNEELAANFLFDMPEESDDEAVDRGAQTHESNKRERAASVSSDQHRQVQRLERDDREEAIRNMEGMGFGRVEILRALEAANNNPDRAIEYLLVGVPENAQDTQNRNAGDPSTSSGGAKSSTPDSLSTTWTCHECGKGVYYSKSARFCASCGHKKCASCTEFQFREFRDLDEDARSQIPTTKDKQRAEEPPKDDDSDTSQPWYTQSVGDSTAKTERRRQKSRLSTSEDGTHFPPPQQVLGPAQPPSQQQQRWADQSTLRFQAELAYTGTDDGEVNEESDDTHGPHLCPNFDCPRSKPGNGFTTQWHLDKHIEKMHRKRSPREQNPIRTLFGRGASKKD